MKVLNLFKAHSENEDQHEFKIFYYRKYLGSVWGKNIKAVDTEIKNKSFEWLYINSSILNRKIKGNELKRTGTSRMRVYEQEEKSYYYCMRCNTIRPEHFFIIVTQ